MSHCEIEVYSMELSVWYWVGWDKPMLLFIDLTYKVRALQLGDKLILTKLDARYKHFMIRDHHNITANNDPDWKPSKPASRKPQNQVKASTKRVHNP